MRTHFQFKFPCWGKWLCVGCAVLWISSANLHAQVSLFDSSFAIGSGADGRVYGIVVQDDGKIVVGGDFTQIAGQPRTNLARLHGDGQLDVTFAQGTDGPVYRLLQQPDGKILIGGGFTNLQGVARQRIGRLLTNGVVDSDFDAGTTIPAESAYLTFGVQPDGKILAAPRNGFQNVGYFLKRFDPDGQLDPTFIQTNVFSGGINAICVRTNGLILVGGHFGPISNNTPAFLALIRTNGEIDTSFSSPIGTIAFGPQGIYSMVDFPDSSVLICGQFSKMGSTNVSSLVKLTPALQLDTNFQPDEVGPWESVVGISVNSAIRQPDGKFVLGGHFDLTTPSGHGYYDARFRLNIVRLDSQGKTDPCFDPELTLGGFLGDGGNGVFCLAQQADGKILAGGNFHCYNGSPTESVTSSNLVRFLPQGDCNPTRVHLVRKFEDYYLIGTCAPGGTNHLQVSTNLVDWTDIDASPYDMAPFPYLQTWLPLNISAVEGGQFFRVKKKY